MLVGCQFVHGMTVIDQRRHAGCVRRTTSALGITACPCCLRSIGTRDSWTGCPKTKMVVGEHLLELVLTGIPMFLTAESSRSVIDLSTKNWSDLSPMDSPSTIFAESGTALIPSTLSQSPTKRTSLAVKAHPSLTHAKRIALKVIHMTWSDQMARELAENVYQKESNFPRPVCWRKRHHAQLMDATNPKLRAHGARPITRVTHERAALLSRHKSSAPWPRQGNSPSLAGLRA